MSGGKMRRSIYVTTYIPDERIQFFWRQTSGTGMSILTITPKEYFNKITRNNQGNVDEIIVLKGG